MASGDGVVDYVEGRLLDGFLLLAAGGSSAPEGVITVNLSSLQIVDVAEEDLAFFGHLDRLDVGDNQLGYEHILEQLGRIPRLSQLSLACNSISSLQVGMGLLQHLETLDLSFNGLHGDVLTQLARLPSLVTLNLSSNCISSLPPEEELGGLQALETLILDANDLVQFMQWRALDALPCLKKLSLSSNRVKRLKDDAPDTACGATISYFTALEELDLSSNEIASCHYLPVLQLFQNLKVITLSDNPCGRNSDAGLLPGINVVCNDSKPFYMNGYKNHQKTYEPKLKLDTRRLHKVAKDELGSSSRPRSVAQIGHLDEEANQLLIQMSGDMIVELPAQARVSSAPASTALVPAADGLLNDELSEEELDQIFRQRKASIEQKFEAQTEEPTSFMRQPEEASSKEKLLQLMRQMRQQQEEESGTSPTLSPTNLPSQPKSGLFLTGLGDDGPELIAPGRPTAHKIQKERIPSRRTTPSPTHAPAMEATAAPELSDESPAAAFQAMLGAAAPGAAPAAQGGVQLPPIIAGSAAGHRPSIIGVAASPALPDLRSEKTGAKTKTMADAGVREAIKALRAAAMSEYAVAA